MGATWQNSPLLRAIKEYIDEYYGGNIRAAARVFGVKYETVYKWYSGTRGPRLSTLGRTLDLLKAAGKLNDLDNLTFENRAVEDKNEGEVQETVQDSIPQNREDRVANILIDFDFIPRMNAVAGCGESYETIAGESGNLYAFRKDFLRRQGLNPKDVYVMYVSGDSMKPTIEDGDMILIHKTENVPQEGYIYALTLGDTLMVKRLQKMPDGWILKSDNPMYSPLTVQGQELNQLVIHGRVRWFSRIL